MIYECTQAEQRILELLWQQGGMTGDELTQALNEACGWTASAVGTLLQRMLQKNVVFLEESENMERYVCRPGRGQVTTAQPMIAMSVFKRMKLRFVKGGNHQ